MTRGVRRAAVLLVLVGAGVLIVGAQAASAQVVEICKASTNGMSGRDFNYTVAPSGGSAFSVGPIKGGRCSGPITVSGATAVITEAQSNPATDVKYVTVRPSSRKTSEDLANRKVTVQTGASTASETLVTFTNQPAGGNYGQLKVCKLTETPAYLGKQFSFQVNGGPIVSTEANDAFADPQDLTCRLMGSFQVGSVVTLHELVPAGSEIQWIDTDPGENLVDFNTASGDAIIQIAAGMTVAYFDNEPTPPAGNGWLEVCKNDLDGWWDPAADGTYTFTVTDGAGATHTLSVLAGQCSEPIQVAAGVNEIVEGAKTNIDMTDVEAFPWDRLLTVNLLNRTATVEVPVSDSPNDETQVHFRNEARRGQLKVCKALGPGSSDLIGKSFYFNIRSDSGLYDGIWITAAAQTQCRIVSFFPIGSTVNVTESCDLPVFNLLDGGGCLDYVDVTGEGDITIQPGVNTKTITNTATGLLEVCKAKVQWRASNGLRAELDKQPTFTFRIDGGAPFAVQAGKCSPPKKVSVGNHSVTESAAPDYELDPYAPGSGITAFPADREVNKTLATRTITVSVPWAKYGGETLVTYYNRIKLGRVKVCKTITPGSVDALSGKTFDYNVYVGQSPVDFNARVAGLLPGECAFASDPETGLPVDYPVLQPNGNQTPVGVLEQNAAQPPNQVPFYVSGIAVAGNRPSPMTPITQCLAAGYSPTGVHCAFFQAPIPVDGGTPNVHVEWLLGQNVNVVTFTNTAGDP